MLLLLKFKQPDTILINGKRNHDRGGHSRFWGGDRLQTA